jgi:hypothetical protein
MSDKLFTETDYLDWYTRLFLPTRQRKEAIS